MLNMRRYMELGVLEGPPVGVAGYVTCELVHVRTGLIAQRLHFKNLITNAGLNNALTDSVQLGTLASTLAVGTSSTPPSQGDVALGQEIARASNRGGISDEQGFGPGNAYGYFRRYTVFTQAQANGNLTEVGTFFGANLWMRALLRDAVGQPTTIIKTPEYELRIAYEVRFYLTVNAETFSAVVNGVATDITHQSWASTWTGSTATLRGLDASAYFYNRAYTGTIGALPANEPSGTQHNLSVNSNITLAAYVGSSFTEEITCTWPASLANGSLRSFLLGYPFHEKYQLPAPITKTNTQKLVVNHRKTWSRI